MARIYIDKDCVLTRSDRYLLTLSLPDGRSFPNLEPHRLFPITSADTYISLLDTQESEVALIRDMNELSEESREAVNACFADIYRIPSITRILDINEKYGSLMWTVETNYGTITFLIRGRYQTVKRIGKRFRVRDNCDNRYEIPDYTKLDKHSKRLLIPYM